MSTAIFTNHIVLIIHTYVTVIFFLLQKRLSYLKFRSMAREKIDYRIGTMHVRKLYKSNRVLRNEKTKMAAG